MFERYPDASVRALFYAKATALATGARFIEVQHLLLGALQAWPDGLRHRETVRTLGLIVSTELPGAVTPEIPFSSDVQRVLNSAMLRADRLGQHRIRPEHLLLALYEEGHGETSGILQQVGVEREELLRSAAESALSDDSPLQYQSRLTFVRRE